MSQQTINLGNNPNDNSGDPLRTAFDKCNNNFTEVYNDIANMQVSMLTALEITRTGNNIACNGTTGQQITFVNEFVTDYEVAIIDYLGIGISNAYDKTENGFKIDSLASGTFGYIAMIIVE